MRLDNIVPQQARHFGGCCQKIEFRPFLHGVGSKMKKSDRQTIRILLFWLVVGAVENEEKNEYFLEARKFRKNETRIFPAWGNVENEKKLPPDN